MTKKNSMPESFPDNRLTPIQREFCLDIGRFSYTYDPSNTALEFARSFLELLDVEELEKLSRAIHPLLLQSITDLHLDVVEEICRKVAWEDHLEYKDVPFDKTLTESEWADIDTKGELEAEKKAKLLAPLVAYALYAFLRDVYGWLEFSLNGLFRVALLQTLHVHDLLPKGSNKKNELAAQFLENAKEALQGLMGEEAPSKGRPLGRKKPEEQSEREKLEFERQIKEAIRKQPANRGRGIKTAVAKALNIGGENSKTGGDTRLQAFNNKLKRYRLDFDELLEECKQ